VGRRTEDAFRRAGLKQSAQGIAAGETRKAVSEALARALVEDGVTDALTGFVDKAGRRWSLDTYSNMVVRTTTREAATHGQTDGYDVIDQLPPFHPNCRHVATPASENLDAFEAALLDG
jgi:hypothetical protein